MFFRIILKVSRILQNIFVFLFSAEPQPPPPSTSKNEDPTKIQVRNESKLITGKSLSEALFLESTNPQYDKRLFIDLPIQYIKTTSSEHVYINYSECQNKKTKNYFIGFLVQMRTRKFSLEINWPWAFLWCHYSF